jgi:hypothetical protein
MQKLRFSIRIGSRASSPRNYIPKCCEHGRVARWYSFKRKITIWVNFGLPWNGKCWNILCPFGIFYNHLEYFITIWNILRSFGNCVVVWYILSLFWYSVSRKIWQPWNMVRFKPIYCCSTESQTKRRFLKAVIAGL